MAGRKRLLSLVKKQKGTLRKCRENPDAAKAPEEIASVPYCAMLSERGTVLFGMILSWLQSMGVASATYTANITNLALRLEEIEAFNEEMRKNGRIFTKYELIDIPEPDENGKIKMVTKAQKVFKGNPAVTQRSEALRHAQSLLSEFGLSPASIGKTAGSREGGRGRDAANPWEALLNG